MRPLLERLHVVGEELAGILILQHAALVEEIGGAGDIRFRLLHGEEIQKREGLPEMMICTEPTNGTG